MKNRSMMMFVAGVALIALSTAAEADLPVLLYEDFDDGDFDGWAVQHPYSPSGSSLTPDIVSSPEGYSIRGVGSGYGSLEAAYLVRPVAMNNIAALSIEMRAKSGPSWPNMAGVWLLNDTQWYRPLDYGESSKAAALNVNLGAGDQYPGWHYIGNRAYEWHTFGWNRDSSGWWSLRIDGQMEAENFWQDTTLSSFNKIALEVTRNQSEIEWVRVTPEPATLTLLAAGLLFLRRRRK
ncbi:MAG TPA: PEP-CTERM sorting domain-containing protein [Phycisphaerae bacterium]|nr:PEP-CTERM sorting domain-containing protein [Phycisphaerae bacterium]